MPRPSSQEEGGRETTRTSIYGTRVSIKVINLAQSNGRTPRLQGVEYTAQQVVADDSQSNLNSISPLTKSVKVTGVVNDANDFVVLPPLNSCPDGHEIVLLCSAGANFELRTPASSAEEINSEDCDGTKEYLCTDTQVVKIVKINNTIGWMAHGYSAIGAVVAAVVPDQLILKAPRNRGFIG